MVNKKVRCAWSESSDFMREYHDTEWGVPQRSDRVLFEYIVLDSFQAGLSWATMVHKREHFRKAFSGFEPEKIARYDKRKMSLLLNDKGIIRHRGKIESTVSNAKIFLRVQKEYGSFSKYLWAWVGDMPMQNSWSAIEQVPTTTKESDAVSSDLKKRGFRFFGSTICYAFMQGAGLVNDHITACFRYKQVVS